MEANIKTAVKKIKSIIDYKSMLENSGLHTTKVIYFRQKRKKNTPIIKALVKPTPDGYKAVCPALPILLGQEVEFGTKSKIIEVDFNDGCENKEQYEVAENEYYELSKIGQKLFGNLNQLHLEMETAALLAYEGDLIDLATWHVATVADFIECEKPECAPDYISDSGSQYWYVTDERGETNIIRYSNHWGRVASCEWTFEGRYLPLANRCGKTLIKDVKRRICFSAFSDKLLHGFVTYYINNN